MIFLFIFLFLFFIFLFFRFVSFRLFFEKPFYSIFYSFTDLISFFVHHGWNNLATGQIIAYIGLFGQGKTLSAVHHVVRLYRRYDGLRVYDKFRNKWVIQHVHVISNVSLSIPYENFISLSQIVQASSRFHEYDLENDTLTCIICLGDEFSVQMNSRNFKSNIDATFLNTLLTCRHYHISLIYTAQRFSHVDALLRQVTSYVYDCHKFWRFMTHSKFDAWSLENSSNPESVKPISRFGWFVRDCDYEQYDTLACVGNLARSCAEGDMLSEDEILANQCNTNTSVNISFPKKIKLKK